MTQQGSNNQEIPQKKSKYYFEPKINWDEAREFYVQNPEVGLRDIAKKYGVSLKTVSNWSKKQDWVGRRKDGNVQKALNLDKAFGRETPEQTNKRHRKTYLEAQAFIRSNMALASQYIQTMYTESKKTGNKIDKKEMYSAQNLKYMMEALKIALDGERVTREMQTSAPSKTQKEIKTANISAKLDAKQLEALFNVAGDAVRDNRDFIDQDDDGS